MADQTPTPSAQPALIPVTPPTAPAGVKPQEAQAQAPGATPAVESDEKFFAALGYFAFLFVVTLIAKPKSAYCKFHARQSMILFLCFFIFLLILGFINSWFGSLIFFPLFAAYVLSIYKAYTGEMWSIPVISTFAAKLDIEKMYGKAGLAMSSISGMKEKAADLANQASSPVKSIGKQEDATPATTPAVPADTSAAKSEQTPPTQTPAK